MQLKINECFKSVQGEGKYAGVPAIFVRTSGCNLACSFCDTKYHTGGEQMEVEQIVEKIVSLDCKTIIFTGGEPTLQIDGIIEIINSLKFSSSRCYNFHIETNGITLLQSEMLMKVLTNFDYIGCSPKSADMAQKLSKIFDMQKSLTLGDVEYDIKIVTDLETEGVNSIPFATCLMPLSSGDKEKDLEVSRKVFEYCGEHNINFGARLHTYFYDLSTRGK